MASPRSSIADSASAAPAPATLFESKGDSTSQITDTLQRAPRKVSCSALTGNYNPGIPQLPPTRFYENLFKRNGLGMIAQELCAIAKEGVAELIPPVGPRFLFISDPNLTNRVFDEANNLVDSDDSGIQPKMFEMPTIVAQEKKLPVTEPNKYGLLGKAASYLYDKLWCCSRKKSPKTEPNPKYGESKQAFRANVFDAVPKFVPGIQKIYDFYQPEFQSGRVEDLKNLAERFAISVMCLNVLGMKLDDFSEPDKTRIADYVHHIVDTVSIPAYAGLMIQEHKLRKLFGKNINITPSVTRDLKEADELFKTAIRKNEKSVFETMRHFTQNIKSIKEYKLDKPEDLYTPEMLGLMKLILAGGFETTSKLILYSWMFLGNPKNKDFVEKLRKEMAEYKKPPEEWTFDDLQNLKYLKAFVTEMLRLFPPFTFMKASAKNGFWLNENIYVPAGTTIITSAYDAHRNESIYKNAKEFNPERWLTEEFKDFCIEKAPFSNKFFTFGRLRACPGRRIPFYEDMIMIGRLLSTFDFTTKLDHDKPLETQLEKGFTLELAQGINVSATFTPLKPAQSLTDEYKEGEKVSQRKGFSMTVADG